MSASRQSSAYIVQAPAGVSAVQTSIDLQIHKTSLGCPFWYCLANTWAKQVQHQLEIYSSIRYSKFLLESGIWHRTIILVTMEAATVRTSPMIRGSREKALVTGLGPDSPSDISGAPLLF